MVHLPPPLENATLKRSLNSAVRNRFVFRPLQIQRSKNMERHCKSQDILKAVHLEAWKLPTCPVPLPELRISYKSGACLAHETRKGNRTRQSLGLCRAGFLGNPSRTEADPELLASVKTSYEGTRPKQGLVDALVRPTRRKKAPPQLSFHPFRSSSFVELGLLKILRTLLPEPVRTSLTTDLHGCFYKLGGPFCLCVSL